MRSRAWWVPRYEGLDDERTARRQARGDGGETCLLADGIGEHEQGVEGHEHDVEGPRRKVVDHVAKHSGHALAAVSATESSEHRRTDVDSGDVVSEPGEGDRQPAGSHRQLEDPCGPCRDQRVEKGDCRRHVADVAEQFVVHVGDAVAVGLRSVSLHRWPILMPNFGQR